MTTIEQEERTAQESEPDIMSDTVSEEASSDTPGVNPTKKSWLSNLRKHGLKIQIAVAITLIVLVASLSQVNTRNSAVRDGAYQQMVDASARGDYYAVLIGAEDYLTHPPISHMDGRRVHVVELYNKALVNWCIATNTTPPSDRQERINRYRALILHAQ